KSTYNPMALPLLALAGFSTAAHAVKDLAGGPAVRQLNLHPAATRIAAELAWLHWFMLITCTVIFLAVIRVMFHSNRKPRQAVGQKAAHFSRAVTVELVWTVIPFFI